MSGDVGNDGLTDDQRATSYFEGDAGVYKAPNPGYDGTTTPTQGVTMDRNKRIGLIFAVSASIVFWAALWFGIGSLAG